MKIFIFFFCGLITIAQRTEGIPVGKSGTDIEKEKEYTELYDKLCTDIGDANEYAKTKNWQLLGEYEQRPVPEKFENVFVQWQSSYKSINRFLKYCKFLFLKKPAGDKNEFKFIALKPNFENMTIGQAMPMIYESYLIVLSKFAHFISTIFNQKNNDDKQVEIAKTVNWLTQIPVSKRIEELKEKYKMKHKKPGEKHQLIHEIPKKTSLSEINFQNGDECMKVNAWVYVYIKNKNKKNPSTDLQIATDFLSNVKQHLPYGKSLTFPPLPYHDKAVKSSSKNINESQKAHKIIGRFTKIGISAMEKKKKKKKHAKKGGKEEEEEEVEEEESLSSSSEGGGSSSAEEEVGKDAQGESSDHSFFDWFHRDKDAEGNSDHSFWKDLFHRKEDTQSGSSDHTHWWDNNAAPSFKHSSSGGGGSWWNSGGGGGGGGGGSSWWNSGSGVGGGGGYGGGGSSLFD